MERPNFLFIMVDELRAPVSYENDEIKKWRQQHLKAENYLKQHGFSFNQHYTASTACCPSRASIFTGQYPSLHGVSQTNGIAKEGLNNPDMFWLDPFTVPTIGDYFQSAGYDNMYIGKVHFAGNINIFLSGENMKLNSFS